MRDGSSRFVGAAATYTGMSTQHTVPTPTQRPARATVYLVAALARCHLRTAVKILAHGPDAVVGDDLRERARAALAELGLGPPTVADGSEAGASAPRQSETSK